jgi:hypothetical protein
MRPSVVSRLIAGQWPDGITPGFVELGAVPTSGAGFQAPKGSIARVGTEYYVKTGTTATGWTVIAAQITAVDEAFRLHGQYYCAGVSGKLTANDTECENTGSAGIAFGTYQMFYPEVAPFGGVIDSLGMYTQGGGTGSVGWVGVFRNTVVSGNPYPGSAAAIFEDAVNHGFDGNKFRTGTVSVSVSAGELFWIGTQWKNGAAQRGYRLSQAFRTLLGCNVPDPLTTTMTENIGYRTSTEVAYDAAITVAPAGMIALINGSAAIGPAGGPRTQRPSCYFRYT